MIQTTYIYEGAAPSLSLSRYNGKVRHSLLIYTGTHIYIYTLIYIYIYIYTLSLSLAHSHTLTYTPLRDEGNSGTPGPVVQQLTRCELELPKKYNYEMNRCDMHIYIHTEREREGEGREKERESVCVYVCVYGCVFAGPPPTHCK